MNDISVAINEQGTALLELNRPEKLNVLNASMMAEILDTLRELDDNENVMALILTGRGRGFCAGADLAEAAEALAARKPLGDHVNKMMLEYFNPMMEALYTFRRPVVSAINGIAAGGGAALALCADVVLASESSSLKFVQVPHLGIVADLGANWLLPRTAGRSRALGACLLGDTLTAARMQEWGLVWECVDSTALLVRAHEIATRLALIPTETLLATRDMINGAPQKMFKEILEEERQHQRGLCADSHFASAISGFLKQSC